MFLTVKNNRKICVYLYKQSKTTFLSLFWVLKKDEKFMSNEDNSDKMLIVLRAISIMKYSIWKTKAIYLLLLYLLIKYKKGNAFLFFQNNIESLDAQRQWQHICGIKQSLYVESYIIIVACCRCVWIFSLKLYESPSSEG